MRVGEIWRAKYSYGDDLRFLFKIINKLRSGRSVAYVGIKLDWKTKRPMFGDFSLFLFHSNGRTFTSYDVDAPSYWLTSRYEPTNGS